MTVVRRRSTTPSEPQFTLADVDALSDRNNEPNGYANIAMPHGKFTNQPRCPPPKMKSGVALTFAPSARDESSKNRATQRRNRRGCATIHPCTAHG